MRLERANRGDCTIGLDVLDGWRGRDQQKGADAGDAQHGEGNCDLLR
jgi:hypothetical protein